MARRESLVCELCLTCRRTLPTPAMQRKEPVASARYLPANFMICGAGELLFV